jgi:hypothetical protein
MIVKTKSGKYLVKTHDKKRTLGTHDNRRDAEKQLAAVEASKARKASTGSY